ncbi:putative surface protein with fasciclin (FAS1) repeats [Novosphingobium sp. PhB57]|uniref:fasciclin domain-containing protein n=1 Tax=Novosphingobium sp. PhB57 TaxID=2485107 RepID=UPI00104E41A9|nr:fasciclin domain-containing protein [Novosphingobium sp. PhB57]TCU59674.1 putative surface protein with fasciclin (FAS1) repeats [Novosphingobium sp. PhB57]
MRKTDLALTLLAAAGLSLAACSDRNSPEGQASATADAAAAVSETLPQALDNAAGLQTVAEALKETGIEGVFQEKGSYTLIAPEDDAFAKLGDPGKQLTEADDHAALAALLKDHMLTGYMTPQDISAAIKSSKDGKVLISTLGGGTLTFTQAGGIVNVSAEDGTQASFDGDPVTGGSSIAIPVTGVLKKL